MILIYGCEAQTLKKEEEKYKTVELGFYRRSNAQNMENWRAIKKFDKDHQSQRQSVAGEVIHIHSSSF